MKTIEELTAEIEALKARVVALEARPYCSQPAYAPYYPAYPVGPVYPFWYSQPYATCAIGAVCSQ